MTIEADGYVFVKGCNSCPLRLDGGWCGHPGSQEIDVSESRQFDDPSNKAHPDCPLRKHSLHIALEPTA